MHHSVQTRLELSLELVEKLLESQAKRAEDASAIDEILSLPIKVEIENPPE